MHGKDIQETYAYLKLKMFIKIDPIYTSNPLV